MNPAISTIVTLYKLDNSFFQNGIAKLDEETAREKISEHNNPIFWLVGHLTNVRYHLLNLLGQPAEFPWPKIFSEPYDDSKEYPSIGEIYQAWDEISETFLQKLSQVTDSDLSKPLDYKLPHNDNTVMGAIIFFAYHESWHLGQIAFIRKNLGMEGLVPY